MQAKLVGMGMPVLQHMAVPDMDMGRMQAACTNKTLDSSHALVLLALLARMALSDKGQVQAKEMVNIQLARYWLLWMARHFLHDDLALAAPLRIRCCFLQCQETNESCFPSSDLLMAANMLGNYLALPA